MIDNIYSPLKDRSVISVSGDDAKDMLQNIISNDINKISDGSAIYAFLLTPQGKYLFDFFILFDAEKQRYLIDIHSDQKDEFLKKLKMYKLRSKVDILDLSDFYEVAQLVGDNIAKEIDTTKAGTSKSFCKGYAYIDPRSTELGVRSFIERENKFKSFETKEFSLGENANYISLRIENLIAEGAYDMIQEKSFPLQFGMRENNGVDFKKGCYVGQEVTARTHHMGKIRKKIYRVKSEDAIAKGETIFDDENRKIGITLTSLEQKSLALLDIEATENAKLLKLEAGQIINIY
jgi:folate-binding protein YgfZ